jgi:DNA-directed RNA polymerase subunit RPC12/RpoP
VDFRRTLAAHWQIVTPFDLRRYAAFSPLSSGPSKEPGQRPSLGASARYRCGKINIGDEREAEVMAKGYECPVCGTYTVHPESTNKMRCSRCNSQYDKEVILSR